MFSTWWTITWGRLAFGQLPRALNWPGSHIKVNFQLVGPLRGGRLAFGQLPQDTYRPGSHISEVADPEDGPKVGVMGPGPDMGQGPIPKKWSPPSQVDDAQTAGSCGVSCSAGTQHPAPEFLGQYSGAHGLSFIILPADRLAPHIGMEDFSGKQFTVGD